MSSRLHLALRYREVLLDLLREHLPEVEAWAYGSRVNGQSHDGSDLDLVLRAPDLQEIPALALADFSQAVHDSTIPVVVEARDWARLSRSFRRRVEEDHVRLRQEEDERVVKIGSVAHIVGGGTPSTKRPEYFDGEIPWLTPKDLSGEHDRRVTRGRRNLSKAGLAACSARLVPRNSVLLTSRAPVGYVALAANPIATNQGFRSLLAHDSVVPEYLYYWLRSHTEELRRHASGSTFEELSARALGCLRIRLPSRETQDRIADVLGVLDDKIELNRRMGTTLDQMARVLFDDWFVKFGPTRAKMEGRQPYLPEELWSLFPSRMWKSELGLIPENWTVTSLEQIAITKKGVSYRHADLTPSATALVTLKSFSRGGGYRPGGLKPFGGHYEPEDVLNDGEIVVACTDMSQAAEVIGRPALVPGTSHYNFLVGSLDTVAVRSRSEDAVPREWLYRRLATASFTQHCLAHTTGTTVLHLAERAVGAFRFVLPGAAPIRAFREALRRACVRVGLCGTQADLVRTCRDSLLPALLSGVRAKPPGDHRDNRADTVTRRRRKTSRS